MKLFSAPASVEWMLFGGLFLALGVFIVIAEIIRKKMHWPTEVTRKLVHVLVGVLIYFAPQLFFSGIPAILLAVIFTSINLIAIKLNLLQGMHGTNRHSFGTVYYPLSFLILVLFLWDSEPAIISVSMLVLALGDATAAIVGENLASPHTYRLTSDKKSIEGSITMAVVTFIAVVISLHLNPLVKTGNSLILLQASIACTLFVTAWEAISSKGFDNLTVPLSTAFILHYFLLPLPHHLPEQFLAGLLLGAGIGVVSYYFHFLAPSGCVGTFLLASVIYGVGGWLWTIPILTFFIASSLLSKIGKKKKKAFHLMFEKTDTRDAGQVTANGGAAGILILGWYFYPEYTFWYPMYISAIAAVTADTWGTEIGVLMKGSPRSLINFRKVETGTSGAVSLLGLIGGAAGASLIAGVSMIQMSDRFPFSPEKVITAGVIGALVDSFLGATVQAQYRCSECGKITERVTHCGIDASLVRGYRWIDNDLVNWCCAVAGAGAYLLL